MCIVASALFIRVCNGGEFSESGYLFNFIQAVDPENKLGIDSNGLVPHPCSRQLKGVRCNLPSNTIVEIRLEDMNLRGILDTDSLCKLSNLRVLSLAKNHIHGSIHDSISGCTSLIYLNLSSNLLNGSAPMDALSKLKNLRRLDISNNQFEQECEIFTRFPPHSRSLQARTVKEIAKTADASSPDSPAWGRSNFTAERKNKITIWTSMPLVVGIAFFLLLAYFLNKKAAKLARDKQTLKFLAHSPLIIPPVKSVEDQVKAEEGGSELVFFVAEEDRFKLEDLLESAADLQSQGLCSSLYKVQLKNNAIFAVKRLKKLQASFEQFDQTMKKIGRLQHQNVLPLVGYSSSSEEKLLIYKYQRNGSLLSLFENYIEGRRDFPWKFRLSIAIGIARGLDFLYQSSDGGEIIPHGNIKLSNILLNEYDEPLISEYGYSKFLDPKIACLFNANGYTAPEKCLTEAADVFSFGVILLELLTGKIVEKSGLDLPKWVKSIVREEWTGEVFDKEVAKVGMYAFPLLNISLKCVAQFPEHRPSVAELLEKIEEVVNAQEDHSPTSVNSVESTPRDCCLLHTVVPELWDTPGSNP
ncbi:hypothetical protein RJ639_037303 [Escallonia herrerae]|uniref:Protein kinase domain-containing protein n=1 Tax=Escallonia herrerae TaxID=1293975 RepID=A0AA89B8Q8_9ASTE|nr:hypothetical protein RJ639_037303 [Escallonia herrerae]